MIITLRKGFTLQTKIVSVQGDGWGWAENAYKPEPTPKKRKIDWDVWIACVFSVLLVGGAVLIGAMKW